MVRPACAQVKGHRPRPTGRRLCCIRGQRMRKVIVLLLLCAIVVGIGVVYFTTETKQKDKRRGGATTVAVETARIRQADLGDRVVFTGSIVAEERYDAAPKIAGIIRQVNFNVGDIVEHGDILAALDDDEHILTVEQAEAKLQVALATANDAEAQLEIARRDYDRIDNLHRERVVSSQEFDKSDAAFKAAAAKYDTAAAQVKLSQAELKTAQVRLGYTRIRADWDGGGQRVIGQRFMDAGAHVNANTPILSVLDINTVRAVIPVSEREYPKITLGDTVAVTTDAFPGRRFIGRVSRIPQELGTLTREAEVEVAVNNPDRALKPGMFIRADLEFRRHDNAIAAPLAAVVRRDDGSRGVYLVTNERDSVTFEPVIEGIVDGPLVELVNAGSLQGREVVVMGQHLLKDGTGIRVADSGARRGPQSAGPPDPDAHKAGAAPATDNDGAGSAAAGGA